MIHFVYNYINMAKLIKVSLDTKKDILWLQKISIKAEVSVLFNIIISTAFSCVFETNPLFVIVRAWIHTL